MADQAATNTGTDPVTIDGEAVEVTEDMVDAADRDIWNEFDKMDNGGEPLSPDAPAKSTDGDPLSDADQDKKDQAAFEAASDDHDKKPDIKPAADTAADVLWANATPEQKAAIAANERVLAGHREQVLRRNRENDRLKHEIAELRRGQNLQSAAGKAADDDDEGTTDNPLDAVPGWVDLKKDYSEIALPVEAALKGITAKYDALAADIADLTGDKQEQFITSQVEIVTAQHKDYFDIAKSDAFHAWYDEQPAYMKAGVQRNAEQVIDGDDVADIITKFKTDTGWAKAESNPSAESAGTHKPAANTRRNLQLESAANPRGRSVKVTKNGLPDADGDPQEIWDAFEEQDRKAAASSQ